MSDPIKTPCYCPGKPHENDEFTLADKLPIGAGLAAAVAGVDGGVESIVPALLRHGAIASWNLVDEKGNRVPITPATVDERLTWETATEFLSEALPRLISSVMPTPLGSAKSAKRTAKSSRSGQIAALTSVKTSSSPTPPTPSE